MSGIKVFSVEHKIDEGAANKNNQALFTAIYKFFNEQVLAGNADLVALHYGFGGTGTDFYDGASPFGENAFAVFRMKASASTLRTNDFYVLIQWADNNTFGAAPGSPGKIAVADGVGIVAAACVDGSNPWNGTSNADGADTKGSPVWSSTTSTVVTSHRPNHTNPNGTGVRATNIDGLNFVGDASTYTHIVHIVGDADGVAIVQDKYADASLDKITYAGVYVPRGEITVAAPLVFIASNTSLLPFAATGSTTQSAGNEVSIVAPDDNVYAGTFAPHDFTRAESVPDTFAAGWNTHGIGMYAIEGATTMSLLGWLPDSVIANVGRVPALATTAALDKVVFGKTGPNTNDVQYITPWDGVTPLNSGVDKTGVQSHG